MPPPRHSHEIAYPNRGPTKRRYDNHRRWLLKFTGRRVKTETQLLKALTKPDVFYIVPEEWRRRRPKLGNDADQVLG